MSKWLDTTQQQAQKILGDKAQFPPEKPDMDKLQDDYGKAFQAFDDARSKLEDAVQDFENAISSFENGLKTNRAAYDKEDFGLDPKNPDDKKKITQALKLFMDFFAKIEKRVQDRYKEIEELNKHAIQLAKYKAPKTIE
ncbi:MAG: hypothetical protein JO047_11890 [Alphaproteobacteria bacterium]|nr:hypothetical protein [Alphaproteobacteria bacterium]